MIQVLFRAFRNYAKINDIVVFQTLLSILGLSLKAIYALKRLPLPLHSKIANVASSKL